MADLLDTERFEDNVAAMLAVEDGLRKKFFTGLVATVPEDSQDGHTTKAQPVMMATVTMPDGTTQQVSYPQLEDIPIHHAAGGQVVSTHPTSKDDEILLMNAARNFDSWHQNGGEQTPVDGRMHALSDMVSFGQIRSDPKKIASVSQASSQRRSIDGNHVADLHPQNGVTHQSQTMVLSQVGDAASSLLTASAKQAQVAKILYNCG